jgi:hypothetical protein
MAKIEKRAAEQELNRMLKFWRVENIDPSFKNKLISAISDGRITLKEDDEIMIIELIKPVQLENGSTIDRLEIKEPDVRQMENLDKMDRSKEFEMTAFMISLMTGQPVGVIERLKSRDFSTVGALVGFFF